jgi:hypothetical protein
MTERSVHHASFTIERQYPHPPARVSAAFATPRQKLRWFAGGDEQGVSLDGLDNPAQREAGTRELLEALGAALESQPARAS